MRQYLDLVERIIDHGVAKSDRTGVGTRAVFGHQMRFDLADGFPVLTTKKLHLRSIIHELLWFLAGDTNVDYLHQHDVKIWDEWADESGNLGPIYGHQWRNWGGQGIDQIGRAIELIKNNPDSRRIIVSAWNVGDLDQMALPPCHAFFQFYVCGERLDCQLYQRSGDVALGVPFNIASYALLMILIANECGLEPGVFVHTIGDAHIYSNHIEGLEKQLQREPHPLPRVTVSKKPLDSIAFEDITLHDYVHEPFIRFQVAV